MYRISRCADTCDLFRLQVMFHDVAFCSWYTSLILSDIKSVQAAYMTSRSTGDFTFQMYCLSYSAVLQYWSPQHLTDSIRNITSSFLEVAGRPSKDVSTFLDVNLFLCAELVGKRCVVFQFVLLFCSRCVVPSSPSGDSCAQAVYRHSSVCIAVYSLFRCALSPCNSNITSLLCCRLIGPGSSDAVQAASAFFTAANVHLGTILLCAGTMCNGILLNRLDEAYAVIEQGDSSRPHAAGIVSASLYLAFKSLVLARLRLLRGASDVIDASLAACRPELAKLALDAPVMFAPLHALVEAELASQDPGTLHTAIELYDAAITSASQHRMTHYHALACELAGAFYLRSKSTHLGRRLIREAVGLYEAWGATAVAQRVRTEYAFLASLSSPTAAPRSILKRVPDVVTTDAPAPEATASHATGNDITNTTSLSQAVDFDATVRFCQVLSRQHSLEDIMTEFKSIVKLCSGATGAAVVFADEIFPDGEVTDGTPQLFERPSSIIAHVKGRSMSVESEFSKGAVSHSAYPHSIVQYAAGSRDPVLLQYVLESEFAGDAYFRDGSHQV